MDFVIYNSLTSKPKPQVSNWLINLWYLSVSAPSTGITASTWVGHHPTFSLAMDLKPAIWTTSSVRVEQWVNIESTSYLSGCVWVELPCFHIKNHLCIPGWVPCKVIYETLGEKRLEWLRTYRKLQMKHLPTSQHPTIPPKCHSLPAQGCCHWRLLSRCQGIPLPKSKTNGWEQLEVHIFWYTHGAIKASSSLVLQSQIQLQMVHDACILFLSRWFVVTLLGPSSPWMRGLF